MAMTNTKPAIDLQGRYSVRETCQFLGISRETLRRHTLAGDIKVRYRKINLRPYYVGPEIMRYWNNSF